MDSAEDNFKIHDYANESADSDDKDSECVDSEKINFTAAEEDKESTSDRDEEDVTDHSEEAAVVQMLKEKEDREKEAEDPDYGEIYSILNTDEVIQKESQNEGRNFRVFQNKLNSQDPGKELLSF